MPIDSGAIVMVGQGIEHDIPPNDLQQKLADGIHLRWSFQRALGFPWYGFTLLRRPHGQRAEARCITGGTFRAALTAIGPTTATLSTTLTTAEGEFLSDAPIVLTDNFPPTGVYEFDLTGRSYLNFAIAPAYTATSVKATVGFRQEARRTCVDFERDEAVSGSGELIRSKVRFDVAGGRWSIRRPVTSAGPIGGLLTTERLDITLPEPAVVVAMRLTVLKGKARAEAFDRAGTLVAQKTVDAANATQTVDLAGADIARVVIDAQGEETFLNELCFKLGHAASDVTFTAYLGTVPVASTVVHGAPGAIVDATLQFDAITAVQFSSADAALIELCIMPLAENLTVGWELCPHFPAPLGLPVTDPDYPATGNAPIDEAAAKATALARITYGSTAQWSASFSDLHDELLTLVIGGPSGTAMAHKTISLPAGVAEPADGSRIPTLAAQSPLDLLLMASLNPAMAQMLGLYWVDRTAVPGVHYDYLIAANYSGPTVKTPQELLKLMLENIGDVEGYVCFDLVRATAAPLTPPADAKSYAIVGTTRPVQGSSQLQDATNNAGLTWDLNLTSTGVLRPGAAVMYHVWRASLGDGDLPVAGGTYDALTKATPILNATPVLPPGVSLVYPTNWPPFSLMYIDSALADGWYGYEISGVDIFGRHTPNSAPAAWYQWTPMPDPQPWYYQLPAGDTVVNASAIQLLHKAPPPPPSFVHAVALDPLDTTLVHDAAYQAYAAWVATLSPAEQTSLIGLRVGWKWTAQAMLQAPLTGEFRIYYQGGRPNTLSGTVSAVGADTPTTSAVTTTLANTQPANAFAGATLWIAGKPYTIVSSDPASPLVVHVTNIGRTYTAGTVTVTSGLASVTGVGTAWDAGLIGSSFQVDGSTNVYTILNVSSATQLTLSMLYAEATTATASYATFQTRPPKNAACTIVVPRTYAVGTVSLTSGSTSVTGDGSQAWTSALVGHVFRVATDLTQYRVAAVAGSNALTLDQPFSGPASGSGFLYTVDFPLYLDLSDETNWAQRYYVVPIGAHYTTDANGNRTYDLFIPQSSDATLESLPLAPTASNPIVYAQIGVSAADGESHSADDPKWNGTAYGNRAGNESAVAGPAAIFRINHTPPPPPVPPPDSANVYATPANYHSQSFYTYRWQPQPTCSTHVFRALDQTVFTIDYASQPRAAINAIANATYFPNPAVDSRWTAALCSEVAGELNVLALALHGLKSAATPATPGQIKTAYAGLSNDALRILAGLPGNERAFTQLTSTALDPNDPANANLVGPDNPPAYAVDPSLRAYIDTIDGRSTNRYFYRAAYVDGAHNRGPLGLSGPPVYLPKVFPPRAPVLTKVLGGNTQIELHWASNREPDLAQYLIYRADTKANARDLRLMHNVNSVSVPSGDPSTRPAANTWTDTTVAALTTYYYCIVAIDTTGNVSPPSLAIGGRAYDEALPIPPPLTVSWTSTTPPVATISWTSTDSTRLEHVTTGGVFWDAITGWLAPGNYAIDDGVDASYAWNYRLRVLKTTNALAVGPIVTLAAKV